MVDCPHTVAVDVGQWKLELAKHCKFDKATCVASVFKNPDAYAKCPHVVRLKNNS
jgi:hypothetical protein